MFLSMRKKERGNISPEARSVEEDEQLSPVLDLIEDDLRTFEEKYVVKD